METKPCMKSHLKTFFMLLPSLLSVSAFSGGGQFGEKTIMDQARQFLQCAAVHPVNFTTPQILFVFCNGVTQEVKAKLLQQGVDSHGTVEEVDMDIEQKLKDVLEDVPSDCGCDQADRGAGKGNDLDSHLLPHEENHHQCCSSAPGIGLQVPRAAAIEQRTLSHCQGKAVTAPDHLGLMLQGKATGSSNCCKICASVPEVGDTNDGCVELGHCSGPAEPRLLNGSQEKIGSSRSDVLLKDGEVSSSVSTIGTTPHFDLKGNGRFCSPSPSHVLDLTEQHSPGCTTGVMFAHQPIITKVNLDITTIISLVSNMCHGHADYIFKESVLSAQAEEERKCALLPKLTEFMEGL